MTTLANFERLKTLLADLSRKPALREEMTRDFHKAVDTYKLTEAESTAFQRLLTNQPTTTFLSESWISLSKTLTIKYA